MNLRASGRLDDCANIVIANAGAWKNLDAPRGSFDQPREQVTPFIRRRLLAGRQHARHAEIDQRIQCVKGITRDIEGAVKDDGNITRVPHEFATQRDVDRSIKCQGA